MKSIQAFINNNGPRCAKFAAIQFIVLTLLAMLFYPGGILAHPGATRYLFFHNFFSELGLTQVYDGTANTVSAILFFVALTIAGLGLVLFFLALPHYFSGQVQKGLCYLGSFFGVISGLSFIGVAFTPANLALEAHSLFVFAAFISFFVAVLFYALAVFRQSGYPLRYAVVYLVFAGSLGAYIYLLFAGPETSTAGGRMVQVTGQKMIAYATVIVTLIQANGLEKMCAPAGLVAPA